MRTICHYEGDLRWQLEELEFGVIWPLAYEDMSLGPEERPLLEAATMQSSE
jgi:hypothetical protein